LYRHEGQIRQIWGGTGNRAEWADMPVPSLPEGQFQGTAGFCGFAHAEWSQRRTSPKSPKTKREQIDAGGGGWVSREGAKSANGAKVDLLGAP
jgi:hypothetical protein